MGCERLQYNFISAWNFPCNFVGLNYKKFEHIDEVRFAFERCPVQKYKKLAHLKKYEDLKIRYPEFYGTFREFANPEIPDFKWRKKNFITYS